MRNFKILLLVAHNEETANSEYSEKCDQSKLVSLENLSNNQLYFVAWKKILEIEFFCKKRQVFFFYFAIFYFKRTRLAKFCLIPEFHTELVYNNPENNPLLYFDFNIFF